MISVEEFKKTSNSSFRKSCFSMR